MVASLLWPDNSICTGVDLVISFTSGFCEVVILGFSVVSRGLPPSLRVLVSISDLLGVSPSGESVLGGGGFVRS